MQHGMRQLLKGKQAFPGTFQSHRFISQLHFLPACLVPGHPCSCAQVCHCSGLVQIGHLTVHFVERCATDPDFPRLRPCPLPGVIHTMKMV